MPLAFHQVDAFTAAPFAGNPAIVYRLERWLDDALMQRIAAEHNLAESAFVVAESNHWQIRWFTPKTEVPLCGHATLAAAKVLFDVYQEPGDCLRFSCLSGELIVRRLGARLQLDFPLRSAQAVPAQLKTQVDQALGCVCVEVLALDDGLGSVQELIAVLDTEAQVRGFVPDLAALKALPGLGVVITATGEEYDFVSRYFAPSIGLDEDPVTGSTHCILLPYWATRLQRKQLRAYQCSARGGELHCLLENERALIAGDTHLMASGQLFI